MAEEKREERPVNRAELKSGVKLTPGHATVLLASGFKARARPISDDAVGAGSGAGSGDESGVSGDESGGAGGGEGISGRGANGGVGGPAPGSPAGLANAPFEIHATLQAVGGTPMAAERFRVYDPDSGEPLGEAGRSDDNGVIRAGVPAQKEYQIVIENDPSEEEELPSLADGLDVNGPMRDLHPVLSVQLLDLAGRPIAGEKVHAEGPEGALLEQVTDDDGAFHALTVEGTFQLTIRGKRFAAHTVLLDERDEAAANRFILE